MSAFRWPVKNASPTLQVVYMSGKMKLKQQEIVR